MRFELDFYSSEIERIEALDDALLVRFSAAHVYRVDPETGSVGGYAGGLVMCFTAANWVGDLGACIGGVADGSLAVDGLRAARLPLPLNRSGVVDADFRFINGTTLTLRASTVQCDNPDPALFSESYAC